LALIASNSACVMAPLSKQLLGLLDLAGRTSGARGLAHVLARDVVAAEDIDEHRDGNPIEYGMAQRSQKEVAASQA